MTETPATSVDLVHYPDSRPGITRRRRGRGFSYVAPDGTRIDDTGERRRIEALAVPPAYDDVWICPLPRGHLQATGRDARNRKQYRYHPDWMAYRARTKFDQLAAFGAALPRLRRHVLADLGGEAGDRDFAVAAVIALMDRASMRVGNRDYADENGTFGATTLKRRHVGIGDGEIRLEYTSKGGATVRRRLRDRTLNRVLQRLDDLPGADLATWIDDDGAVRSVTSHEVNERLAEIVEEDGITAKTFRTWNGTIAALNVALEAEGNLTIRAMAEAAADRLANTASIARNSYIHPAVIDLADRPVEMRQALLSDLPETSGLRIAERALLRLLD